MYSLVTLGGLLLFYVLRVAEKFDLVTFSRAEQDLGSF